MFKAVGLVALAVALAPIVDAAAPEWGQVGRVVHSHGCVARCDADSCIF